MTPLSSVKCKLFDTLVKPILCYGCEIWSITGGKTALAELERTQIGFLKMLLGADAHQDLACACRIWQISTAALMAGLGRQVSGTPREDGCRSDAEAGFY